MIVMCEGCETNFQVEDQFIKSTGSKVRCSKCRHVFTAYSPAALAAAEEPLILSETLPAESSINGESELPDISSQINGLFADDFGVAADTASDQEPEELDVEDLLADDSPTASALTAGEGEDDLKLDLDFDLDFSEETTTQSPSVVVPDQPATDSSRPADFALDAESVSDVPASDTLASLDELGINLDAPEGIGDASLPAATDANEDAGAGSPEIDLDLEMDLNALVAETADEVNPEAMATEPETAAAAEVTDDFLAEPDFAGTPEEAKPLSEGELDLSDLEAMLDGDSQDIEPQAASTVVLDLELDADGEAVDRNAQSANLEGLDLTGIAGETVESSGPVEAVAELPEEIDLALDVDEGATSAPVVAATDAGPEDELDFSDITNILEEPLTEPQKETAAAAPELDLFLGESPPQAAPEAEAPQAEVQEGLLLDLESLLEQDDTSETAAEAKSSPTSEDLDLDIALGSAPAMSEDLEIEIESTADANESAASAEQAAAVDAQEAGNNSATDPFSAEAVAAMGAERATDAFDMESAAEAAIAAEASRQSGLRKYLVSAAAAVALLGAVVLVPRSLDIQVPFLSDLDVPFLGRVFQSQPEDVAGNFKMAPIAEKLSAEFVDHPGAGRLCVVKGEVRNNYDHPRSAIRVTAKLFKNDKTLAKSATVFAGNVIPNQDLLAKDLTAITAQLKTKEGASNQNMGVKPGRTVPFMVVFDSIPDNLDEYSVEVAGSTK
jgi:predicted Zn finger-like uncharacterized protein